VTDKQVAPRKARAKVEETAGPNAASAKKKTRLPEEARFTHKFENDS
jgi:hypothetical protein